MEHAGFAVLFLALGLVLIYVRVSGIGGWAPDGGNPYAARARDVASRLRIGMTREEVRSIFQEDINHFPKDRMENTSNAYWGQEC